ncbi:unnamed protein product [Dovyalis caffra]|uniref:Uncharacterized protein n=1 Tax=Dovyalis caffra TaxID=77055 RepID=A0AAV1R7T9_9ROSI|nr:unnamed protein product [Dovyalis caffra]
MLKQIKLATRILIKSSVKPMEHGTPVIPYIPGPTLPYHPKHGRVAYTEITYMRNKSSDKLKATAIISFTNLLDYYFFSFKHFHIGDSSKLIVCLRALFIKAVSLRLAQARNLQCCVFNVRETIKQEKPKLFSRGNVRNS